MVNRGWMYADGKLVYNRPGGLDLRGPSPRDGGLVRGAVDEAVWMLVAYIRLLSGTTGLRLPRFASQIGTTGADAPVQSDKRQP